MRKRRVHRLPAILSTFTISWHPPCTLSDAVLFHVDSKTGAPKYQDTSQLFRGQSTVETWRDRVSVNSCDLTSQAPFDVRDAH